MHTVASRDADLTHETVRRAALERGVRVVLVTEHREALDERGIALAAERCRDLSEPHETLLVPGLEIASDEGWQVLGFGLERPVLRAPAAEMADEMRRSGGYPVLAHPSRYRPGWGAGLERVGALEVWNRHYDGRLAPDPAAVAAWRRAVGVRAVFGLDAHGPEALTGSLPELSLEVSRVTEDEVRRALLEGRFETAFEGRPMEPAGTGLRAAAGEAYRRVRRAARRLARALPVPEATRRRLSRRW